MNKIMCQVNYSHLTLKGQVPYLENPVFVIILIGNHNVWVYLLDWDDTGLSNHNLTTGYPANVLTRLQQ